MQSYQGSDQLGQADLASSAISHVPIGHIVGKLHLVKIWPPHCHPGVALCMQTPPSFFPN
jgi:hypothetical protein